MGRRQLAGRDKTIEQGHRRDEFFARMRRKGGVPRIPTQAPASEPETDDAAAEAEDVTTAAAELTGTDDGQESAGPGAKQGERA